MLSYGIYFWWYRFFKNLFYRILKRNELTELDTAVITLLSGCINAFLTNPIWLVNTRMTTAQASDKKSLLNTIRDIYNKEGFMSFYKGVLPNMLLVVNPVINFVIYELLRKVLVKKSFSQNTLSLFLASSIAKTIATIFTYPILTIRVKL